MPPAVHFMPAAVVALGDSITYGLGAGKGRDWPSDARRLLPGLPISNRGINGNTVNWPACRSCGLPLVQRFDRDVTAIPGAHTLVILEGVNDIREGGNTAEIEEGLATVTREAHTEHLRVIGCTILPFGHFHTAAQEAMRQSVNVWIVHAGGDDAVIDTAATMADPKHPTRLKPAYDSGDGLHPNAVGYEALARAIVPALK